MQRSLQKSTSTQYERNILKKLDILDQELKILHEMEELRIENYTKLARAYQVRNNFMRDKIPIQKISKMLEETTALHSENYTLDQTVKIRRLEFNRRLNEMKQNPILIQAQKEPEGDIKIYESRAEQERRLYTDPPTRNRKFYSDMTTHKHLDDLEEEIYIKKQKEALMSMVDNRNKYELEMKEGWRNRVGSEGNFYFLGKDITKKLRDPKKEI